MYTFPLSKACSSISRNSYESLNNLARDHRVLGSLAGIPVCLLETGLLTASPIIWTIESIALTTINLCGAPFSDTCTLKDAIKSSAIIPGSMVRSLFQIYILPFTLLFTFIDCVIRSPNARNFFDRHECPCGSTPLECRKREASLYKDYEEIELQDFSSPKTAESERSQQKDSSSSELEEEMAS